MAKPDYSLVMSLKQHMSMFAGRPLFRIIFVPSFFIFLVLCGVILLGSSFFLDGQVNPAGVALLAVECVVFPLVYCNALRIQKKTGRPDVPGNIARAAAVLIVAIVMSGVLCVRMRNMLARDDCPPDQGSWAAHIENVVEKRYYREAIITFSRAEDPCESRGSRAAVYRGMARITGRDVAPGDTIRFSGRPVAVGAFTGSLSSFNRSLLLRGIRHVFYLDGRSVAVAKAGSSFRERARKALASNCDRLFNRETSAMVKALYFGNQDYIAKTTMNDFKRAGVFHILSAGGLHVGVIAAIPLFLLGIVRVNRRIIMATAVIAVFLYLYVTDAPVCLLRSCIMFFMYAAQRITGRDVNIFNTLFLSGAVILMMFPYEIFGLGFQLSYGATLGILLFHGSYRKTISWLPGFVSNPLALTLSAQLLVLPVLLVRMNELNLTGLLSNIIVVPLMSLLLVASLAANALSFMAVIGLWAGQGVNVIYWLGGSIVRFMSGLGGHFFVPAAGPVLIMAYFLLAAPLFPRLRSMRCVPLSIAAAVAIAWITLGAGTTRESVTLVRHSEGALMMVKKGTLLSIAGQVPGRESTDALMRTIAALSPREVELHITNPDYRNMTGFTVLMKRLPVRRCYLSDDFRIRRYSRRFLDILERDGSSLMLHECGAAAGPEKKSVGTTTPEDICRLYRDASAGVSLKNIKIQYLTLH